MNRNDFRNYEIRIVANGYWLAPCRGECSVMNPDEIRVFESFESLARWMKANLQPLERPSKVDAK